MGEADELNILVLKRNAILIELKEIDSTISNMRQAQYDIRQKRREAERELLREKSLKDGVYIVRSGDCLSMICHWLYGSAYGVESRELKKINAIVDTSLIHPGQKLILPA